MRRLFLSLYHKQIISYTPITSFSLFLSYIVVMPLMLGFEKEFSCHFHLGPIRIPPLFPFHSAPFPQNDQEDGTSIETKWFHVLSSIGYSSPFVSLFPISVSISSQD